MNKIKKSVSSAWGLTILLFIVLHIVITILMMMIVEVGYIAFRYGWFTSDFLHDSPWLFYPIVFVICLVLSITITFLIQRALIQPIFQMTQAVQRLADGDFEARLTLDAPFRLKAVRTFADSFNKTAEQLNSVEILRSDFINNFSHEFKTPIHSLVSIAELLKSGACSPEETAEYLDIIIDQSKRLAALSANVLYLTKLETNATPLEMENVNLSELLRQRLVMFDHKCGEKNLQMEESIQPVELSGYADLLSLMMSNILDNAIKFSPDGSVVAVELLSKEEKAIFKVTDHGYGMDKATVTRIFDKFYQGDSSHTTEGFGLGLPMVKKIVELHHGQLKVESQIGKGTAFTIELPVIL